MQSLWLANQSLKRTFGAIETKDIEQITQTDDSFKLNIKRLTIIGQKCQTIAKSFLVARDAIQLLSNAVEGSYNKAVSNMACEIATMLSAFSTQFARVSSQINIYNESTCPQMTKLVKECLQAAQSDEHYRVKLQLLKDDGVPTLQDQNRIKRNLQKYREAKEKHSSLKAILFTKLNHHKKLTDHNVRKALSQVFAGMAQSLIRTSTIVTPYAKPNNEWKAESNIPLEGFKQLSNNVFERLSQNYSTIEPQNRKDKKLSVYSSGSASMKQGSTLKLVDDIFVDSPKSKNQNLLLQFSQFVNLAGNLSPGATPSHTGSHTVSGSPARRQRPSPGSHQASAFLKKQSSLSSNPIKFAANFNPFDTEAFTNVQGMNSSTKTNASQIIPSDLKLF